jgi:hypothetical protein
MNASRLLILIGVLVIPRVLQAAEIRVLPADYLILNPTNADRGFSLSERAACAPAAL